MSKIPPVCLEQRSTEIHNKSCPNCPIENVGDDPECREIRTFPKELIAKEYLFYCYMRQGKLCKGICDYMDIDQEYLDSIFSNEKANIHRK